MPATTRNTSTGQRRDRVRDILALEPGAQRQAALDAFITSTDSPGHLVRRTVVYEAITQVDRDELRHAVRDIIEAGTATPKEVKSLALESLYKEHGQPLDPLNDPEARRSAAVVLEESYWILLQHERARVLDGDCVDRANFMTMYGNPGQFGRFKNAEEMDALLKIPEITEETTSRARVYADFIDGIPYVKLQRR